MISAIILTKNNEDSIRKCLNSASWCDEIIVIDDYSTDDTRRISESLGVSVFKRKLDNNFSAQRNYGLNKTGNQWVLFVDSDETMSNNLQNEIRNMIGRNEKDGYLIKRVDSILGKKIRFGEFGSNYILRLGRKEKGKWEGKVHEEWRVRGEVGKLKNSLDHFPHKSISSFLGKINFYTNIRAKELYDRGVRTSLISIVFYTNAKFVQNYILKLGFLDGMEGFVLAILMSFHSFLVRGKLWLLWKN